jgi:hypothetical protein
MINIPPMLPSAPVNASVFNWEQSTDGAATVMVHSLG